jgi:hypothetical protein
MLRSLYLNHNRIIQIDAIESLKDLRQLSLFNNEILSGTETIRILKSLPKLKELATDFNPCSSDMSFNFEIVLTLPKLKMFNDEAVRELDKDVARQHFRLKGVPIPGESPTSHLKPDTLLIDQDKENPPLEKKKSVRFKVPAEDDNEWQQVEIKRL